MACPPFPPTPPRSDRQAIGLEGRVGGRPCGSQLLWREEQPGGGTLWAFLEAELGVWTALVPKVGSIHSLLYVLYQPRHNIRLTLVARLRRI